MGSASRRHSLTKYPISMYMAMQTTGKNTTRTTPMASLVVPTPTVVPHTVGDTFRVKGLTLTDHLFELPLDYGFNESASADDASTINVFVREVIATSKASDPGFEPKKLPALLFLQGGPGFEAARPAESGGWLAEACKQFRVFLLDQRGTGRSTKISLEHLELVCGDDDAKKAAYITHHRADSIVADAESIRHTLLGAETKWTLLGQSFGGFCITRYLSASPTGVRAALYTGGLPPLIRETNAAYDTYQKLFKRIKTQNEKYYRRFPMDVARVLEIAIFLEETGPQKTPSGGVLSTRGLQALGFSALGVAGGFERLHYQLETAWEVPDTQLSYNFLKSVDDAHAFDTNCLYAAAHESIYCNGNGAMSNWSAEKAYNELVGTEFDVEFVIGSNLDGSSSQTPLFFTGEMVFPFMFDEMPRLKPLKNVANILAQKTNWSTLYSADNLNSNAVPVACASYAEDAFVDWDLANETATEIKGARVWTTSEYMHSGIREDGANIFSKLLAMARGEDVVR